MANRVEHTGLGDLDYEFVKEPSHGGDRPVPARFSLLCIPQQHGSQGSLPGLYSRTKRSMAWLLIANIV